MKRAGILFLTFLYAIAVIGISLSVHYCGKRINSVSLGIETKKCCCGDKKEDKKGCCTTKTFSAKVTDTHQPASQLRVAPPIATNLFCYHYTGPIVPAPQKSKAPVPLYYKNWHLPMGNPLFLRNRNILI